MCTQLEGQSIGRIPQITASKRICGDRGDLMIRIIHIYVVSKVFNMNFSERLVVYQQHISTNALEVDYFSLRAGIAVNE